MASSVFIWPGFFAANGATINPQLPIAFPDGVVGAPAITWQNALTSGWYRSGANDFRWATAGVDVLQITASSFNNIVANGTIQVPSGGSFTLASTGFITATGTTGVFQFRNIAASAGFCLSGATDGVLIVRDRTNAAFGTVDCLGLKSSGSACPSFGPAGVTSITVVNGLITAIS